MRSFYVRSFYAKIAIFVLISIALLESLLLVFDTPLPEEGSSGLSSSSSGKSLSSYSSAPSAPPPDGSSFSSFFSASRYSSQKKKERDPVDMEFLRNYFSKTVKSDDKQAPNDKLPSKEQIEKDKAVKEKEARDRKEKEEEDRLEQQRRQREILASERAEKDRLEKERAEKERVERERQELERIQREKLEKEKLAKEEQERIEKAAQQPPVTRVQTPLDPFKAPPLLPLPLDGKTKPTNILTRSTSSGDSIGYRFLDDPRFYSLCHFKNACVNSTSYMIIVNSEEERNYYTSQLEYCGERSQRRMTLCACFTKQLAPIFVAASSISKFPKKPGHWWVSDKWVFGHQISHWAEKLVNMHSVMQKWDSYELPPVNGIAFLKDSLPMSDHEQAIFEISTSTFPQKVQTMWQTDFEATGGWCFEQTTMSSLTATIATSPVDADKFRENAYKYFDLEREECPPPKAMLLYRTEPLNRRRMILNLDEVESLMQRYGIKTFDKVTVGAETTSQEQANIFSQYGLILSSHSSQLVNTLFSQPNSTVIEIVPAFFNYDFGEMANQMGLQYLISLGGQAPNLPFPKDASECQESFAQCHGEGSCFAKLQRTLRQSCIQNGTPYKDYSTAIKHLDFKADLAILEESLKKALDHLHRSCGGHWEGASP